MVNIAINTRLVMISEVIDMTEKAIFRLGKKSINIIRERHFNA